VKSGENPARSRHCDSASADKSGTKPAAFLPKSVFRVKTPQADMAIFNALFFLSVFTRIMKAGRF